MTRKLQLIALSLILSLFAFGLVAAASTETTVHSFVPEPNGGQPYAGLIADSAGNYYGTTEYGGAYGVAFRLSRNSHGQWTETVLHNFTGGYNGPDGSYPTTSLTLDHAGNLYGTTRSGGAYGCGTVFKLTPASSAPWKETILHSFACYPTDGASPSGSLIFDSAGNLYGVTNVGGSGGCGDGYTVYGCGAIYELSPSGSGYTETIIYSFGFNSNDESNPAGALTFDKSGNLYGTAQSGGASECGFYYGCGTVFTLTKGSSGWAESTIYNFAGTGDGDTPSAGVVFDAAGDIYGTTEGYWSYGSVFELVPSSGGTWTETTLFNASPNFYNFYGAPVFDASGNLYVSAVSSSRSSTCTAGSCGAIFKLSQGSSGWATSMLYSFTGGADGDQPWGTLLFDTAGDLYTTTSAGANSIGSVDKLTPASGNWRVTVLYDFPVTTEGKVPNSGVIADGMGNYYGTTTQGGTTGSGTVFKLSPNGSGWKETILYSFTGIAGTTTDGANPLGNLVMDASGTLYGTTEYGGGTNNNCYNAQYGQCGTVYKLAPNGDGTYAESILHTFTGYATGDGATPIAGLIMDDAGNLYGTTEFGGTHNGGTAFMLSPSSSGTWTETVLDSFGASSTDTTNPDGPLVRDSQGNLYGTGGGFYGGYATVFRLSQSGSAWTESVLFTFNTQNSGSAPEGGLILDSDGNLYGTTRGGGLNESGIVYKLSPSSSTWTQTVLYNFTGVNGDGSLPQAGLIFDSAGNLYGTTTYGGTYSGTCNIGCGTVFELMPTTSGFWHERVLYRFPAGLNGSQPVAPVMFDSVGDIFGTTSASGAGASGLVFEIKP